MKKRWLSTLLVLCMVLALLPGTAWAADNECGLNATWKLSGGTLTISGTGRIYDYSSDGIPWYSQRQEIRKIVVNSGITAIGNHAFSSCNQATSVTLPDSVTTLGQGAFSGCTQITNMMLPDGVTTIGRAAFSSCSNLTKITIPASLTSIDYSAFDYCLNLKTVDYGGTEAQWNKIWIAGSDGNRNLFSPKGKINYTGSPDTLTLLSGNCGGYRTGSMKVIWTFDRNGTLSFSGSGILPDSDYRYSDPKLPWASRCADVANISFGNGISKIGCYNFRDFTALSSVLIPGSISSIGEHAFHGCSNLSEVTIQEGVTVLESSAFAGCINLTSITLPVSIAVIKKDAFDSCNRLIDIYYAGTKEQWEDIQINDRIPKECEIHYNSSTEPDEPETCTVTFDANDGSSSTTEKEYKASATLGTLPTPTRSGYKFSGWYTEETGGTKVTVTTKVTEDMTLYAHWTKNTTKTYTITLNANSGKVSPSSIKVESGKTYLNELPTPTRSGYKFDGWYTTKTGTTKITSTTKATANRTIYAHWSRNRAYTVSFDPNGGSVYEEAKFVYPGVTYKSLPTPTRPGYHFKGWYTKKSGGTKITETTRVSLTANQTLYAQWQTSATVRNTQRGTYKVTVPAYYNLALYTTNVTPKVADTAEKSSYQTITCTQKATLSNGTVRYYGRVNNRNYWFTYSCEMDV